TGAQVNYVDTIAVLGFVRGVSMRMRNSTLALLAVAAGAPGAAQTRLAGDSVPPNLYAAAGAGMLSPAAQRAVPFVYVPNSKDGSVSVIDPLTYRVLRTFPTGALPQHVVPSYDLATLWVVGDLLLDPDGLGARAMPQDIRASPDGRVFYVADMMANGVHLVDPDAFRRVGFIATGKGTHGIYPSRDGRRMYISNRGWN